MAKFVFRDAFVSINSVDLSNRVRQVTLDTGAEEVDDTTMSSTYRSRQGGLKDWSVDVQFAQDFAAANVDATLFPLLGSTTAVEVRPTSAARSATNPGYNGTALLASYQPAGGQVGALAEASARFVGAGTLTRSTT